MGRPEGEDLEAVEVEFVDPSAVSSATEPVGPPVGGPPEHWLAYIRARAPGLLEPGGPLAAAARGPGPDVIPHGGMVGRPTSTSVDEIAGTGTRSPVERPEVEREAPASPGAAARDRLTDPATIVTTTSAEPDASVIAAGPPASGTLDDPAPAETLGRREPQSPVAAPAPAPADTGQRARQPGVADASANASAPAGQPGEPVAGPPIASPADVRPASPIEPAPPLAVAPQPFDPWPALARVDPPGPPPAGPFAALPPLPSRPALTVPLGGPLPDAGPPPRAAAAAFSDGWPTGWPVAPRPADVPAARSPTDGWRVEAARPAGHIPADLALPAWPTLPDDAPDDALDRPSVERRLERVARLDLEQRRR